MKLDKKFKKGNKQEYGFHWRMYFKIITKSRFYWRIDWKKAMKSEYSFKGHKIVFKESINKDNNDFIDIIVKGKNGKEVMGGIKKEIKKEISKAVGAMAGAGVI